MSVTISRAAERRGPAPPGSRRADIPGLTGSSRRGKESLLLALAGGVVLLALILTWLAVSRPLEEARGRLGKGEIVDLNQISRSVQLLPLLDFLPSQDERSFVADRIRQRLLGGPLDNVGELGKLRVAAREIEHRRLPGIAARLATSARQTVPLLAPAELRQLKPRLIVRTPDQFRSSFLLAAALLLAGFGLAHAVLSFRRFPGDELLLPILLLLSGLGLALMASLHDPLRDLPLHTRFAQGVLAGCGVFLAGALLDLERTALPRRSGWVLGAAVLLSALLIVFGGGPGGSDVKINLLGFQPVEVIKILIALFLAGYFADRWELLREVQERRARLGPVILPKLEYALPPLVAIGLVLFFFFLQKDLGPALVLSWLFLLLFSVARGRPGMALVGLGLLAAAFAAAHWLHYPLVVDQRLSMWLSPWDTWFRGGDHLAQAFWSMASGAAAGTGLGLGDPGLVPEARTDMILAAVGEELGFLGLLAVIGLYALLIQRGLRAAGRARSAYGLFLALGLTLLLGLETALIAGGVMGLLPLSGVVSPFLSFGRSSMLANFLVVGLLSGISARSGDRAAVRQFAGGVRWVGLGLAAFALLVVLRAAGLQLRHADAYLTRGAVTLQGDGVRRFQYNPRLAAIAAGMPRGAIVDRNGVLL
ncbi:MAG: FtsW/RodA/SpoVE family cell cycle protein, partial [Acidobacteriota bacterium]|nr:FtsW/RodA/SpoVE family cell cycle protein [Acidobacteriota bacterium]